MEDYFDYVHSFREHVNTTSIFNGVPWYVRVDKRRWLRCYRHMTLDPILFNNGILIYLEGNSDRAAGKIDRKISEKFSNFNPISKPDSLLTVVIYYGSMGNGAIVTDLLHYKDYENSNIQFHPPHVDRFSVNAMFENQPNMPFERTVVSMKPGQTVTHALRISKKNIGVILRREYRTVVPNQKAQVKVDGEDAGLWFCPQRALTEEYSLRLHDYHLPPRYTVGKEMIEVRIQAVTQWETISIKVMSIVLTD